MTRRRDDRGAVLVEFALVVPILAMLLFGTITGAMSWDRSMSISDGARQAGRYAATLPTTSQASLDAWLTLVSARAVADAHGDLDVGASGRTVCVAHVHPSGSASLDQTRSRSESVTGVVTYANTPCFSDSGATTERRVQVDVQRTTDLDAVFWTHTIALHEQVVFRYEVSG